MAIYLGNTPIAENVTIQQGGGVTIDDTLSDTSKNPVQNKVINAALNSKADKSDIPTTLPANGGNADTSNSVKTTVLIGTAENCAYSSILDWANNTSSNAWACVISAYGFPTDAPTQNEAIVSLECDTTTARKYVEWKVYAGDQHKVLRRCIYGTNWNGDWINIADGGNADTLDGKHASDFALKTDIPTTLPANGGVANTARQTVSPNAKARLWEDSEGGNLRLASPDGNHSVEMDLYNNSFRMYFTDNGELTFPVDYNSTTKKFNINGNAATVNGLTVQTAVPANAKFTDTTYGAATASTTGLVTTGAQTFAGNKTFNGQIIPAGASAVGTAQARKIYAGTSDMTAGTTALETGAIYLVYE